MFRSKNKNPGFWIPAVKAGTENPGFLFLKDLVVFYRCSHVIETAALIQIYILQRADQVDCHGQQADDDELAIHSPAALAALPPGRQCQERSFNNAVSPIR